MEQTNLPAVVKQPTQLSEWITTNLPWFQEKHDKVVAALNSLKEPTNDEEYEYNNSILTRVKDTCDIVKPKRMEFTRMIDEIKSFMMEFERPMDYTSKANNLYNEKRGGQEKYMQKKLEAKKEQEREAAHRRAVEDHKVDIATAIKNKLAAMLTEKERALDAWVLAFFKDATGTTFADFEKRFRGINPILQTKTYEICFDVVFNPSLLAPSEFDALVASLKEQEPYDKWNGEFLSRIMPIWNAWLAKLPQIKADIIAKESAASEEDRKRIEEEQLKKQEEEQRQRQAEIDRKAQEEAKRLEQEAEVNKMRNSFQEQGANQELENVATKKVLTFLKPQQASALTLILYAVFTHEKFPGIQKKDKNGPVFDDNGRPVYIPAVQWWVDFYLKNCDFEKLKIPDTLVDDVAKVTVRR